MKPGDKIEIHWHGKIIKVTFKRIEDGVLVVE